MSGTARGYRREVIGEQAARLRREYEAEGLVEEQMAADPFLEFLEWFDGVVTAGFEEPNAFVLATVDEDGGPSARAVLMKGFSADGIVFYTGMESRKSRGMRAHGRAAATFVWVPLHRQVRFEGAVAEVDAEQSDAYFASRPRGAQISAHASHQSEVVSGRRELEERYEKVAATYGNDIPRPDTWGGWLLKPDRVEFWQGRPNRFHDRIVYRLSGGSWLMERLAP